MTRRPALLLCALAATGAGVAHAAQPTVDADLLEFLGSIGEDDDWQDFLEHKPVKNTDAKPAKATQKTPAKSPEVSGSTATPKEKDK